MILRDCHVSAIDHVVDVVHCDSFRLNGATATAWSVFASALFVSVEVLTADVENVGHVGVLAVGLVIK